MTPCRYSFSAAFAIAFAVPAVPSAGIIEVDVALVLAVDVSSSMDQAELELQRAGYVAAITDPAVVAAIEAGAVGRIAITYLEWAGPRDQVITVPWWIIDGPAAARGFADELADRPIHQGTDTSISAALRFAAALFDVSGASTARRVIDLSGDGPNTAGPTVAPMRDAVVAGGVVVNGLPLLLHPAPSDTGGAVDLSAYYRDCVTGGPEAFVLPVRERSGIVAGIRRKLVLEIALALPRLMPAAAMAQTIAADCTAGQKEVYE